MDGKRNCCFFPYVTASWEKTTLPPFLTLTEYTVDRRSGLIRGPFRAGKNVPVKVFSEIRKNECFYSLNIPLEKFGSPERLFLNVMRLRKLYADFPKKGKLPPHEQQIVWNIEWDDNRAEIVLS